MVCDARTETELSFVEDGMVPNEATYPKFSITYQNAPTDDIAFGYRRTSLCHYLPEFSFLPGEVTPDIEKVGKSMCFNTRRSAYETRKSRDYAIFSEIWTSRDWESNSKLEDIAKKHVKDATIGKKREFFSVSQYLANKQIFCKTSNPKEASKACWRDLRKKLIEEGGNLMTGMVATFRRMVVAKTTTER